MGSFELYYLMYQFNEENTFKNDLKKVFCRRKRSVPDPEEEPSLVHGGERAFLYEVRKGSFIFTNPTIMANIWSTLKKK